MAYLGSLLHPKSRARSGLSANGLRVAGVMSGTSCDGLDVACAVFDGRESELRWKPLWSASAPYPAELRRRVLGAQEPGYEASTLEWLRLHRDLGRWYAAAIARIVDRHRPRPHLIANHGQTLAHFPDGGMTLQMGDATRIAQATGISVASHFREGDLAAGGQGAPLVPRFHALLARELGAPGRSISIHNIGGISNLTYFAPRGRVIAFDTGPGNAWIDAAASHCTRGRLRMDLDGRLARSGRADEAAVRAVLRHPFFAQRAHKSTGRDEFPFEMLRSKTRAKGADLVATATAVTVESIARAYEAEILDKGLPLDEIRFCGGGAKNPAILEGVADRLGSIRVASMDDPQMIEALAFAHAGCLALLGHEIGGPWTGAKGFGPPAHLIPATNWAEALSRLRGIRSPR